jgi:hypothetical protein
MCTTWCGAAGAINGAIGSADTTLPFSSTNPTGVFIHALAALGRTFVRDRAVFEIWRALLQESLDG